MDQKEPRALRRARRESEKALLAVEAAALIRIRATVQQVILSAPPALSSAAAVDVSHRIESAVAADVLRARTASRRESQGRFAAELTAAGYQHIATAPRSNDDAAIASQVAKAYASAWLAATLAEMQERPVRDAMLQASTTTDYRVKAIASTEVAKAFTSQRQEVEQEYTELAEQQLLVLPLKTWWARLDACKRCIALHGSVRLFGTDFASGMVPGHVHTHCRCFESVVPIPMTRETEAA